MIVLYFGDVYGRPGRTVVKAVLPRLKREHEPDFTILNGENLSHGNGLLPEMAQELLDSGVDAITTGNHAFDQKQIFPVMDSSTRILRPANYPDDLRYRTPGRGSTVLESRARPGARLGLIQVMGRVFMNTLDCPFRAAEREADRLEEVGIRCVLVDFHGEATSEKQAFAHFMDGRVSAIVGSHSHVQTADERILAGGTAAITDVGMCGCFDSVIGVRKDLSIQHYLSQRKVRFEPAEGPAGFGAVVIDIDEQSGRSRSIRRLREAVASP